MASMTKQQMAAALASRNSSGAAPSPQPAVPHTTQNTGPVGMPPRTSPSPASTPASNNPPPKPKPAAPKPAAPKPGKPAKPKPRAVAPRRKKAGFIRSFLAHAAGEALRDTGHIRTHVMKKISEDAVPTNVASSGAVAGLGGSSGEPGVGKKKKPILSYKIFRRTRVPNADK